MFKYFFKYKDPESTNTLNPDEIIQGHSGVRTDENYALSGWIAVQPGQSYTGYSDRLNNGWGAFAYVLYYDLDKNRIDVLQDGGVDNPDTTNLVIPSGVYFMRVSFGSEKYAGQDPTQTGVMPGAGTAFKKYYRSREVKAIYKKMDREWSTEGDNRYYRQKLKGSFKVVRRDYDWLAVTPLDQRITLVVVDEDQVLENYRGYFYKTDVKWDGDRKMAEITKVEPDDQYEELLSGLDKEYNLIQIEPELQPLILKRRNKTQIYIGGNSVLTTIMGGTSWEEDLQIDPTEDENLLVNTYKFQKLYDEMIIVADYFTQGLISTDVTGKYVGGVREDGVYALNYRQGSVHVWDEHYYEIARVSDGAVLYRTPKYYGAQYMNEVLFKGSLGDTGDTGEFRFTTLEVYVRWCYAFPSDTNYPVPDPDIVRNDPYYKYIKPASITDIYYSGEKQVEPTEWGRAPKGTAGEGLYYKEYLTPPSSGLTNPKAVSPTGWTDLSIWHFDNLMDDFVNVVGGAKYELEDTYTLDSVINALLEEMRSPLRHFAHPDYSQLLYAAENPLGAFTYQDGDTAETSYAEQVQFFIAPKSNVIYGTYDSAASKAPIKLGQVLKWLRDCFRIFWHIEEGRLRLEHISWYQNGGSYDAPVLGTDLTNLEHLPTNKKWEFGQNKWEYNKEQMPERFEFGWMDKVSRGFEGFPIEIISGYVQKGRIEPRKPGGLTTDVDFLIGNQEEVSKDGFCLIGAIPKADGSYEVPITKNEFGYNKKQFLQNGILAWMNLHPKYHVYDLPADQVKINDQEMTLEANNTKQKTQEVTYPGKISPGTLTNLDPYKLVRTGLGDGIIDNLRINQESLTLKATIKHDTE